MHDASPTITRAPLVHPIRAVAAPECPFDGVLARDAHGRTVVLVDRELLVAWPGWDADGAEHVWAPLDVWRRPDGHDVVLPALRERVDRFLARRDEAGAALRDGELVTLAVSVLRGATSALRRSGHDRVGEWWITSDGRPLLVEGVGDASCIRRSATMLSVAADLAPGPLSEALSRGHGLLSDPRVRPEELEGAAEELFARAAPEPLALDVLTPAPLRRRAAAAPGEIAVETEPSWWRRVAEAFDADLAAAAVSAGTGVLRRLPRLSARRRVLAVAGGLAAAVLVAGLLWPDGEDPAAAGPADAPISAAPAVPGPSTAPPEHVVPPTAGSPDVVLADLLRQRHACTDASCLAAVVEDPGRALAGGAIDAEPAARRIRLVDDLGGLAVLAVETPDGTAPPQLVTIVDTEDGWRIRDAYAIADPPP